MNAISLFVDNTSPSVEDTIRVDEAPFNLTGSTVRFQMRAAGAASLKVDAPATIVNAVDGEVRYDWQAGDTDTIGGYRAWWHVTLPTTAVQDTPEFGVEVLEHADTVAARALCSLLDVFRLVPGFDPQDPDNAEILETCQTLIGSESTSIMRETGREIVAITGLNPRTFDLTHSTVARRGLPIGDAAAVSQVELFDYDGTTSLGVIDPALYILLPRVRETWEPFTRIRFPYRPTAQPILLAPGRTLHLTGTWGFPVVPPDLRQACAKRVLLRYVADNANAGTRLADALDDTFSIGALLQSSRDVVDGYSRPGFA
jgi:hypothetical protein